MAVILPHPHLQQYVSNRRPFASSKVQGKIIRQSLDSTKFLQLRERTRMKTTVAAEAVLLVQEKKGIAAEKASEHPACHRKIEGGVTKGLAKLWRR